jgi:cytochrome c biogenesis protein CcmG/thiol:disulfide interchange protein DsbE
MKPIPRARRMPFMPPLRIRLAVLLSLLALSLFALRHRGAVQRALYGVADAHTAGRPAPELPPGLPTVAGPPLRLADLRGKVVLLHFWTFG